MTGMDRLTISGSVNKIFSFVIAMGVAVCAAIPFAISVKAEEEESSNTYIVGESGECYKNYYKQNGTTNQYHYDEFVSDSEVRVTIISNSSGGSRYLCFVSLSPFTYSGLTSSRNDSVCSVPTTNTSSLSYNGITYYYSRWNVPYIDNTYDIPVNVVNNTGTFDYMYRYTFGDLSVDPEPEPEPDEGLGQLKDVSYSTDIIGYQGYGYANKDTISWNRFSTTTNHYLTPSYHEIEIRVVSAEYLASTESGLKLLDTSALQMDLTNSATLYRGSPDPGYFTVSWQQVFTALSLTFTDIWDIKEVLQNQTAFWTREGWVYQIRIYCIPEDEYSEWQNIYPLTSSSGDSMQGFTSIGEPVYNTDFNDYYDLVNSMNNTSIVNNNYNNIMTINNNEYLTNPDNHITNETNNDITNNFIENFKQYHEKEDDYIGNFQDVLEDIDPTSEVIDDANFLSAGNWVKTQYVRMVQGTPIEKLVQFSLTLGLGILIIGKAK